VSELRRVARYDRIVGASIERAWENVRDWEHLPWLHASAFRSIELIERSEAGWRARIGLQPEHEIVLELVIEGDRYVSRTLEGPAAGSEIWTRLRPLDATRTEVRVRFDLPGLAAADEEVVGRIGRAYVELYTRLWDEDEAMMIARAGALARRDVPAPDRVDLGPREELHLPLDVDAGGRRARVIELDGRLVVYDTTCPHWLGPLEPTADPRRVRCPWHGYVFDPSTRRSCDGHGLRLQAPPALETDEASGHAILRWR
jgi:nitrite reductase/ring-hydroxylating ferredoxin subunit